MARFRHYGVYLAITLVTLVAGNSRTAAEDVQSLASIRLQAEAFILAQDYQSPYPVRFELGHLDSRLRLPACPQPLAVKFARANDTYGNTALTLKCPRGRAWKIHLPVRIDVFDDVAVAARPLQKGQNIDDSAFTFQKQNITRLNKGYYSHNDSFAQLQARRNLSRGSVLTPANLAPRMLVRSGQQVTLLLSYQGLLVKSSGKALHSAGYGETVRVRNSQSQKIVEGVVSGEALVRVRI